MSSEPSKATATSEPSKATATSEPSKATATKEYNLVSVEKTDPPEGIDNGSWYRYVIERDGSTIVGNRSGTRQQVTTHAKTYADELNARSGFQGTSIWAPRQKK